MPASNAKKNDARGVVEVDSGSLDHVVERRDMQTKKRVDERERTFRIWKGHTNLTKAKKKVFFLWRPFVALFHLISRGPGIAMPVQNVEEVHMAKVKENEKDKKVKAPLPSLFSWEGLVARLGFAGAILVAVFCVVAAGITFWNYWAGAAFVVLCGCLPAIVIAGVAGYLGVQKMMNQREEEGDDEE